MIYTQDRTKIQKIYYNLWRKKGQGQHLIDISDEYLRDYVLLKEFHKHIFPYQLMQEEDTVIQCGFHNKLISWGISQPLIMSSLVNQVIAIDPDEKNINAMSSYVKRNDIENITIYREVLWRKNEEINFLFRSTQQDIAVPVVKLYGNKVHDEGQGGRKEKVKARCLDNILDSFSRIDFINLTINGAELDALRGARGILKQHQPIISVAMIDNKNWLWKVRIPILDWLAKHGYQDFVMVNAPPHPWSKKPFYFLCAIPERLNEKLTDFRPMTNEEKKSLSML